jgi:Rrf2 family protein
MIVSRSADYALRAMVYLARLDSDRHVSANEIANEMHAPPFLLSRILQHLVKGEVLTSMKGHHGGFRLLKRPEQVSLFDIIQLIDGPFVMHDCTGVDCGLSHDCNLRGVFSKAEDRLEDLFRSVTLAEASRSRTNASVLPRGGVAVQHTARGVS